MIEFFITSDDGEEMGPFLVEISTEPIGQPFQTPDGKTYYIGTPKLYDGE